LQGLGYEVTDLKKEKKKKDAQAKIK